MLYLGMIEQRRVLQFFKREGWFAISHCNLLHTWDIYRQGQADLSFMADPLLSINEKVMNYGALPNQFWYHTGHAG